MGAYIQHTRYYCSKTAIQFLRQKNPESSDTHFLRRAMILTKNYQVKEYVSCEFNRDRQIDR